jgi:23S rRNA (adenine2503-C2)-methyltransferase
MEKNDSRALLPDELSALCVRHGLKKFRGKQIFRWVQQKGARDWAEMTDISQADKEKCREFLVIRGLELARMQQAKDGTRKYLFGLADGQSIETFSWIMRKTIPATGRRSAFPPRQAAR